MNNLVNTADQSTDLATSAMRDLLLGKPVEQLESELMSHEQQIVSVVHRFGPGLYMRELTAPAGTFIIGHYHKDPHMNVMLKGRITLVRDDGSVSEMSAPAAFVGNPGRKICYVHEEMVWQNIYATTETDIETLEATLFEKSPGWQDAALAKHIVSLQADLDQKDYLAAIAEFGFTEEQVQAIVLNTEDQIPFPHGGYKVMVGDSMLHGKGLLSTSSIAAGELIAPARIDGMRTPAGSKTNHSSKPNARMVLRPNGDIDLVATQDIRGCAGGLPGEEITIDYRQAMSLSKKGN